MKPWAAVVITFLAGAVGLYFGAILGVSAAGAVVCSAAALAGIIASGQKQK